MKRKCIIVLILFIVLLANAQNDLNDEKYVPLIGYIEIEDYEKAFVEATILSSTGDCKAQCVLATMYIYGVGVYRNYESAQDLLVESAKHGYERAEYILGGFGGLEKSREFMKMLVGEVEESNDDSFWNQLMSTDRVPSTYKDAFKWFYLDKGDWGYRDIMFNCGIALIKGTYGYKNVEKGWIWISKSAQLGDPDAINLMQKLLNQENDE